MRTFYIEIGDTDLDTATVEKFFEKDLGDALVAYTYATEAEARPNDGRVLKVTVEDLK